MASEADETLKLLSDLTAALNACAEAGLRPQLRHDTVYTRGGYVLPLDDGKWVTRTLLYTEWTPATEFDDDE